MTDHEVRANLVAGREDEETRRGKPTESGRYGVQAPKSIGSALFLVPHAVLTHEGGETESGFPAR